MTESQKVKEGARCDAEICVEEIASVVYFPKKTPLFPTLATPRFRIPSKHCVYLGTLHPYLAQQSPADSSQSTESERGTTSMAEEDSREGGGNEQEGMGKWGERDGDEGGISLLSV